MRAYTLLAFVVPAVLGCAHPGGTAVSTPTFSNPSGLSTPRGYTHVVDVPAGRTIYIAGQVAFDAQGNVVGKNDIRAQTEQTFRNLEIALKSAGASFKDVVKLNWYVRDISQLGIYREVREQFLGTGSRPASTLVEVTGLALPDLLIEIEAVAAPRG
jgi:2-iminobutanoate/2-iminopropanoate deaminase